MSEIEREIASQPDCWRQAEALAAESVLVLPHAGERVVALGCGTSWFVAQAYAARRAELHMGLGVSRRVHADRAARQSPDRPQDRDQPQRHDHRGDPCDRADARGGDTHDRDHGRRRLPCGRPRRSHRHVGLRRRAFGRADAVRDERPRVPARPSRRGPHGPDRRCGARAHDAVAPRSIGLRPLCLPGSRLERRGWRTRPRSSCASRHRPTPRAIRRWSIATGPISVAGPTSLVWILDSPDPSVADDAAATGATVRVGESDLGGIRIDR